MSLDRCNTLRNTDIYLQPIEDRQSRHRQGLLSETPTRLLLLFMNVHQCYRVDLKEFSYMYTTCIDSTIVYNVIEMAC